VLFDVRVPRSSVYKISPALGRLEMYYQETINDNSNNKIDVLIESYKYDADKQGVLALMLSFSTYRYLA